VLVLCAGCSAPLDAGENRPHAAPPLDARNPIILLNDGATDNWQGEYALVLSSLHGTPLLGIVVNTSPPRPDLKANLKGWTNMTDAATASGIVGVPQPLASMSVPFEPPADGQIDSTPSQGSDGARFIVATSAAYAQPGRPVAVVTGGRLTDVADAYLLDPTIATRIVVVSSLGTATDGSAEMGVPNGEMDPWADRIVATRLNYVQMNAYYDQQTDVPAARTSELPDNAFGMWIAAKQSQVYTLDVAADQVAVQAAILPNFITKAEPASIEAASRASDTPTLRYGSGNAWVIRSANASTATAEFWNGLSRLGMP